MPAKHTLLSVPKAWTSR
uniref:Uncharacterized protein n=1 Tax=Moniliophthora roreri TaxID=221103 RepID=A0A0W0EW33_MONRR